MLPNIRLAAFLFATAMTLVPTAAHAQWRYPPYPSYRYGGAESNLRFDIKPKSVAKTASVYVDGYLAGQVDDFDGAFQRLHVASGQHEIVVFLEGYRSIRQRLYLSPNASRKIEGTLERLSPGEPPEPPPVPSERPEPPDGYGGPPERPPVGRRAPPPQLPPPPDRSTDRPASQGTSRFGTLSIQVQPAGADVVIDGERWAGPSSSDERLIVQVPEGHHRVEVRKVGYEGFLIDVDVRRGDTEPLNISLAKTR